MSTNPDTAGIANGEKGYFLVQMGNVDVLAVSPCPVGALGEAIELKNNDKRANIFSKFDGMPRLLEMDPEALAYCKATNQPRMTRVDTIREDNPIPGYAERKEAYWKEKQCHALAKALGRLIEMRVDREIDELVILRTADQFENVNA